jgi:signal transduction histidine kinase
MVDNALRHGDGRVSIGARPCDGRVEIHVLDEGRGFPARLVDRAFERFSSAASGRSEGGTGLGLAIVAAVAHAHDGTAHAANRAGGGADVWLSLPATQNLGATPRQSLSSASSESSSSGSTPTDR